MKIVIIAMAALGLPFCLPVSSCASPQTTGYAVGKGSPGQTPNLTVGASVPDIFIPKIIHGDKRTAGTTDFKDRLLIIDFWNTRCSGCVEALPRMEALQRQFGKKVKILPVTYEREALVTAFWKKNSYIQKVNLPSVVEDTLFAAYFKHKGDPHEVWIYKGKVTAITGSEYVDAHNIQQVLDDEGKVNWPVKDDYVFFDGSKQPLFTPDPNQVDPNQTFIKYAAISDYKENVSYGSFSGGSGIVRDSAKGTVRFFFLNQPVYTSYFMLRDELAGSKMLVKPSAGYLIAPNEIVWEVADKSNYFYEPKSGYAADWVRKHGMCFESVNPDTGQSDKQVKGTVLEDLDRLLGLHVRWEKRKEKVLSLVRTTMSDKIRSKGPQTAGDEMVKENEGMVRLRKASLSQICYSLNQQPANPYVFDETGYKELVDMDLPVSSWTDIDALRKALQPYGLDLKANEMEVDKLVFSEVDGGLLVEEAH